MNKSSTAVSSRAEVFKAGNLTVRVDLERRLTGS